MSGASGLKINIVEMSNISVKVHPVVLFNIIDLFERRSRKTPRVFGTLLGNVDKLGNVEVSNSFVVLYREKDGELYIDLNLARELMDLHRKVNPNESIVGWFAVGPTSSDDYTNLIHEYYARETQNPIHLCVDPTSEKGIDIKAFVSTASTTPATTTTANSSAPTNGDDKAEQQEPMLTQLNSLSLVAGYETELVALKACANSMLEPEGAPIDCELDTILKSCGEVTGLLDIVLKFIDDKILGTSAASRPANSNEIGRQLMSMVENVIPLDAQNTEAMNAVLKDLLMVIYLSNLGKTQLMLNEKLVLS